MEGNPLLYVVVGEAEYVLGFESEIETRRLSTGLNSQLHLLTGIGTGFNEKFYGYLRERSYSSVVIALDLNTSHIQMP